ncbi:MOSC domain-containing protein [Algirhabdus cladophorae]|uniref:MOSC domain-containing protein n=1 Tax=Algirhabdus cladophorae TaxID=3377108 RepID=UPI003B848CDE
MAQITNIWRHPLKSHGRESLQTVTLQAGQTMPWDRKWAVAHEAAKTDGTEWAPCANFSRGAKASQLMAITSQVNEATGDLTLDHPDRPSITFDPDGDPDAFLDWVAPLMPADRAQSARIVRVDGRGMTDTPFASVSLNSVSSMNDLQSRLAQPIDQRRWRGNFWISGTKPWAEFDWIGKQVQIGSAILDVCEPIGRCLATAANPDTGERDADTLGVLQQNWGHKNFGVYATVAQSGVITIGDTAQVL